MRRRYLCDLDHHLRKGGLQPSRREQLVDEIESHLSEAASEGEYDSTLNRLGSAKCLAGHLLLGSDPNNSLRLRLTVFALLTVIPTIFVIAPLSSGAAATIWLYLGFAMMAFTTMLISKLRKVQVRYVLGGCALGVALFGMIVATVFVDLGKRDGYMLYTHAELAQLRASLNQRKQTVAQAQGAIPEFDAGVFTAVGRPNAVLMGISDGALVVRTYKNESDAVKAWAVNRPEVMSALASEVEEMSKLESLAVGGTVVSFPVRAFFSVVNAGTSRFTFAYLLLPLLLNFACVFVKKVWLRDVLSRAKAIS